MTRQEFVRFSECGKNAKPKKCVVTDVSVCDPSFAQTGRQILTSPLPIEYRMKYPAGVPLNKENPMQFNEFDKLYPDTFKAIREANNVTETTKRNLSKLQESAKKKPEPTPQN